MKYYAIGDLHGRYDLLEKASWKIADDAKADPYRVITLGDYIDRGPQSKQVIEFLMEKTKTDSRWTCLQGNHEDIAIQSIHRQLDPDWWLGNGGSDTLESYGHPEIYVGAPVYYSIIPDEHVKWMNRLPLYYETEKQVFVHAAIAGNASLEEEAKATRTDGALYMQWMLYHPADHGGWRGKHVVHGHHQFSDGPHTWYDEKKGGHTNLDVWAYKTGRIVIGVFDDSQLHALEYLGVTV